MSPKRQISAEEKTKQDAARSGINALRRASRSEHHDANKRDTDNARAVLEYMVTHKGAFANEPGVLRLHVTAEYAPATHGEGARAILLRKTVPDGLEWTHKNQRPHALDLCKVVYQYNTRKDGRRGDYAGSTWELIERVDIPHWDAYARPTERN